MAIQSNTSYLLKNTPDGEVPEFGASTHPANFDLRPDLFFLESASNTRKENGYTLDANALELRFDKFIN